MTTKNLTLQELSALIEEKLADAKALYEAKRYEGAFYICGYAVEIGLKKKICTTLGWEIYPGNGKDFNKYKSFITHDLEVLLSLSGAEKQKVSFMLEWSIITKWSHEVRYFLIKQNPEDVHLMIKSTENLLKIL